MQEAQCLRGLFPLALALLLGSWFITTINANRTQLINSWIRPPITSPKLMETRKIISETPISYRLDLWSQYNNPEEGTEREGDIIRSKSRKTITKDKTLLWPNGIVNYYVHSSIANEPIKFAMLEKALRIVMSKTCIKFVRIREYAKIPANTSWVNVTGHQKGCFSDLGRNAYRPTILNLDVNTCFYTIGHTIHEMLHTLGVYHEHMRPDRDKYITIMWNNIRKGNEFNFRMLNTSVVTDYGLPYDYNSIMHYSMTAFSNDRLLPTIVPRMPFKQIGQRSHLSLYDIKKLLIAYNCSAANTKKLNKTKKFNLKIQRKFLSSRIHFLSEETSHKNLSRQNETVIETEVKSQVPAIIIHNWIISNKLDDKNADLGKPIDKFNQVAFLKSTHTIKPNYYPVPLNQTYPYINFYFYLHKK